jgi:hypothetical protein
MAISSNASRFGRREIHQVWIERAQSSVFIWLSPLRSLAAAVVLAAFALCCSLTAAALIIGSRWLPVPELPRPAIFALAVLCSGLALIALWIVSRVLAALFNRGPIMRLDPSRIVFRTKTGHLVLAWEDTTLSFGRLLLRIAIHPSKLAADAETPDEVVVPLPLVAGGARGLKEAVRGLRPDVLGRG